jgi:transcriptional regulator GlxA family with amidase domain
MPTSRPGSRARSPGCRIALLALPEAAISTLAGIYEVMRAPTSMDTDAAHRAFGVEIVGEAAGPLQLASGLPVLVQRAIDEIDACDVVIVPSVWLAPAGWQTGRYPAVVDWIKRMHARGAVLCSACSGIFLLAESGLFDRRNATVHFGYARQFAALYPDVPIQPERTLVISGDDQELVSSGASTSWHDLVLYLVVRCAGATEAQALARMFALQWHQEGLASYISFEGRTDHGDAEIRHAQEWLGTHFAPCLRPHSRRKRDCGLR